MKLRFLLTLIICIVSFNFITCGDGRPLPIKPRPVTNLLSLKIQPVDFNNDNIPINRPDAQALIVDIIPEPIKEEDWDDSYFNLTAAGYEELWFLLEEHTETARIIAEISPNCFIQWGVGSSGTRPSKFGNSNEPQSFKNDDFLYIKVSTKDGLYYNHYRIHTRLASPVTLISVITVSNRRTNISYDAGRSEWEKARDEAEELPLSIAKKEGDGAEILVSKMNDFSTVKYATLPGGNYSNVALASLDFRYAETHDILVYNPEIQTDEIHKGALVQFTDQDVLIAEVTSQNTFEKNYYKFRVSVGRIATIDKLEMEDQSGSKTYNVLSMGIPSGGWEEVISGNFGTADQPAGGFKINITLSDEDGICEFIKIPKKDDQDDQLPVFTTPATGKVEFDNKEELAIKVKSYAQKNIALETDTMYYKVRVDLHAALIEIQPASAVYYVTSFNYPTTKNSYTYTNKSADETHPLPDHKTDSEKWFPETIEVEQILITAQGTRSLDREIAPLTVKLDREIKNPSYQWYTANSWYGGYGFDKDGRIRGDDDFIEDIYHPITDRGGLDEKNNVAFHNGGNMHYRLPIGYPFDKPLYEGEKIGTEPTYTPIIDASKRPFISGYTNQTQYYWVVVTDEDTGRQIQSERAAIIAEWGEIFDKGKPTGQKVPNKKHYIIDLNKDLGRPKRNETPFTFFREEYLIPLTFPTDFNIMDYSTCVAQAIFYLSDGRTWIQNWTQGDINFYNGETNKIVGYYNLTSDNATKGFGGGSNNPAGARLEVIPTHVGIAVAGEKGPTNLPPFLADGVTPDPGNYDSAQGWFCAFIELVELRFEGPGR